MRGIPGSGKSTIARNINLAYHSAPILDQKSCVIFATDDYWLRPDGNYDFNYDLIKEAHKWNQGRVCRAMQSKAVQVIIVDNVNITEKEVLPYAQLAQQFEYEIKFIESDAPWAKDVEECYKRNTHGVPYSTILRMYQEWESTELIKVNLIAKGVKFYEA